MKRKITRLAAFLLSVIMMVCYAPAVFAATDDGGTIHLSDSDNGGNVPFSADNMFPGDAVSKDYVIEVSHKEPVTLFFHADIRPGYEKLAEVLKLKVSIPDKDTELYDGLMRDMPQALEHQLASSEKSVTYRLTVYLDTSVGNDYQYKDLIADFRWWYLEEEPDPGPGPTPVDPTPAYVKLVAEKLMDNQYARGNDFSFTLSDSSNTVLQTVKNNDGDIEFETLRFNVAGEYTYYITEQAGTDTGIVYDNTVYKVKVSVTKQSNQYVATVTYEKNGVAYTAIPRFENQTKDEPTPGPVDPTPVSVVLKAEKLMDGIAPVGSIFSFALSDSSNTVLQTVQNIDGDIAFAPLQFTAAGEYTYFIKEVAGTDGSIIYDDAVYEVNITVTEQENVLVASLSYKKDGIEYSAMPLFANNAKDEPGPGPITPTTAYVKLTAEKWMDGKYAVGNTFSFVLTDNTNTVLQTVQNKDGEIEFETLGFTSTGTYTYYIKEQAGSDNNIIYDDVVYKVFITVTEENGELIANVAIEKDGISYSGIPKFENATKEVPVVPDNPKTGDDSNIWLYLLMALLSLLLLLFLLLTRNRTLDLNGKKPVITNEDGIISPGMTRDMPFYIQNNTGKDISFKLYCGHKSPALANLLDVTILNEKGTVLCSGKLSALTRKNVSALTSSLDKGQRVDWTARFHLPMGATDSHAELHFELAYADVEKKSGKAGGDHE